MRYLRLATMILLGCLMAFGETLPTNIYAGGVSLNPGASPKIAGTGLYARLVSDGSGTYLFSAVDALPTSVQPFAVTTQFSAGVAQRVLTINNIPIFVPTSAGVSYNGENTGWAWTTGAMAVTRIKDKWRLMPHIRAVKSSVSNGSGYQVIIGVLIGWAE